MLFSTVFSFWVFVMENRLGLFVSFRFGFTTLGKEKQGTDAGVMRTVPTHDRCVSAQDEGALGVLTCVYP